MQATLLIWNIILTAAVIFNLYSAMDVQQTIGSIEQRTLSNEEFIEAQFDKFQDTLDGYTTAINGQNESITLIKLHLENQTKAINNHAALLQQLLAE